MDLAVRAEQLRSERQPFVEATVVRAQPPTSAHSGDRALVLADGTIEGFVGGQCTESSVREASRTVLEQGESMLLRVLPAGSGEFPDTPGATIAVNPCMSGGATEIFLEPRMPPIVVAVFGDSPVAEAMGEFARRVDYSVEQILGTSVPAEASVVIVASHGGDEAGVIRAALDAGSRYVGLVASRTRGAAVLDDVEPTDEERARLRTPVGLDIGARTPAEIGLSIVADIVRVARSGGLARSSGESGRRVEVPRGTGPKPRTAVDPVCGMTVTITESTPHLVLAGRTVWFCCPGCRRRYEKDDVA
ncbi:carbon monoxide dehydrogenase accesory protein [Rhodococcus rhodochrous]|uniref:XdhC family protein n=1 Tax=Rhodococcus rhodochrous TaxID=1829 RepID=UPI000750BBAB|nr:XdhC family protein [Rhodococcus rhodochrous]MDO1486111.1 carbon monoxide dehydrogenase accessory protein [Rhodococcus rhodochrous]SNV17155.1 carbon monoxide dehydrogenase accesory protein [Rhodococcus rhodochrous]